MLPLVAIATPRDYVQDPLRVFELDFEENLRIVRYAVKYRTRVVFPSTSEIYGKNTDVPFREDADLVLGPTTKGRWSYAASKALDEFLALSYWKEKKLPVIVARLFNTVGPRQTGRYGMVLPNFVKSALDNSAISIYGTGKQSRCFCDVRDTVEALLMGADARPCREQPGHRHNAKQGTLTRAGADTGRVAADLEPPRRRPRSLRRDRPVVDADRPARLPRQTPAATRMSEPEQSPDDRAPCRVRRRTLGS